MVTLTANQREKGLQGAKVQSFPSHYDDLYWDLSIKIDKQNEGKKRKEGEKNRWAPRRSEEEGKFILVWKLTFLLEMWFQ